MNTNYDIFISYRRLDEEGNISGRDQARLIAKQLELERLHPFFDYSEIKDNEFDKVIIPAIETCKFFILVLTRDSLNRCKNTSDWVRTEIETAISSGCKIINVSPDNTFNGWPDNLPKSLEAIKTIQISPIHMDSTFESCIKKLIEDRIYPNHYDTMQISKIRERLYQYAYEYDDLLNQAKLNNDVAAFKQSAEVINKIINLYKSTSSLFKKKDKEKLDMILADAGSNSDFEGVIRFIQTFHNIVEQMLNGQ